MLELDIQHFVLMAILMSRDVQRNGWKTFTSPINRQVIKFERLYAKNCLRKIFNDREDDYDRTNVEYIENIEMIVRIYLY